MRSILCGIVVLLLTAPPLHGQTPHGTYVLELTPVPGKEREWPQRTMRLAMSADTIDFMRLRELAPSDMQRRGFPANACFAVTLPDSAFRWAWKARWTPGRVDTVRVRVFQSVDAFTDVRVALGGDSASGIEITSGVAGLGQGGLVATVRGTRIGDADAQWCADVQNAYLRTHDIQRDVQQYFRDALIPPP